MSGMHPSGYRLKPFEFKFLEFEGSRACDLGHVLLALKSTLKGSRKTGRLTRVTIKSEWLVAGASQVPLGIAHLTKCSFPIACSHEC